MKKNSVPLFHEEIVDSNRIIYTPSSFARASLLHIQEIGTLHAQKPHSSKREHLDSFLFFTVISGSGLLHYNNMDFTINTGDCVFIDCKKPYYHSTSEDLWEIAWVHFNGPNMNEIYKKYNERGGQPTFTPYNQEEYRELLEKSYESANSSDYIRDMRINAFLSNLLTLLMKDSWNPDSNITADKNNTLELVSNYINDNYSNKITLDELAERYYINKYYLTRIFKNKYGIGINAYILSLRITKAKNELRFTEKTIEQIGIDNGFGSLYYFSRTFKQHEGISPSQYRKIW